MKKFSVGFVGLSHLGIIYSLASVEKGFLVHGYDEDKNISDRLNNFENIIYEDGVKKILKKNLKEKNIIFSNNIKNLSDCKIVFISKDVPTNNQGQSDTKIIIKLINKVTKNLNKKIIIVILSQVSPGFTRKIKWPHNKLYYQVETLIFGKALDRALNQERIIIGSKTSGQKIELFYKEYLKSFNAPIIKMNYESAELAKISINMLLISNITISNYLSTICAKIGADWLSIIPSLRLDKRIGKHSYIEPGLGLTGGNLERDIYTLEKISKKLKIKNSLLNSFFSISNDQRKWVHLILKKYINNNTKLKISILGLSYKEKTNSIKNSPSISILEDFKNIKFTVYDPLIKNIKNKNVQFAENINDLILDSDILIIMNKSNDFKKIKKNVLLKKMNYRKIIIDPFAILKELNLSDFGFKYYRLGSFN